MFAGNIADYGGEQAHFLSNRKCGPQMSDADGSSARCERRAKMMKGDCACLSQTRIV